MSNCRCGTETRDDAYVCEGCLGELARCLGEIPWIEEQLDITLTGSKGIDYAAKGAHATRVALAKKDVDDDGNAEADAATTLAYHHAASEAARNLRHVLAMWVRFCDEEAVRHQSPSSRLPKDELKAMSRWLLWRVDGLGLSDLGGDAVSEVTRAVGKCVMVIDRPAERQFAGPCECGRDLYAKPKAAVVKCWSCEREYDVEAMREWMRKATEGRLVTAHEGSTLLGRFDLPTAQKTIDSWHDRKRVVDHGKNPDGRWLYLMSDLIALAAHGGRMSA